MQKQKEILQDIITKNKQKFEQLIRTKLSLTNEFLLAEEQYSQAIKALTERELELLWQFRDDSVGLEKCASLIILAAKIATLEGDIGSRIQGAPLNKFLQNVIPAFKGLHHALEVQLLKKAGKLSSISFQNIANYAITEAQKTLNPERDPEHVAFAAIILDKQLFFDKVPDEELLRSLCIITCTLLCVAVCTAVLGAIGAAASGGLLIGALPGFIVGSYIGVFLGAILGTIVYENFFYTPREFAHKQEKLGDKAIYQGVHNLNYQLYKWSKPHCSFWNLYKSWRMTFSGGKDENKPTGNYYSRVITIHV
jgi:hypothetical protein